MNENGTKKREWIKTAAIIFLTIMLILTFFSNTIMNYSLPEVATQYVQPGTITAKIRGNGMVESGDPYEVEVTDTRKVESVAVKAGDTVKKGDVLIYLEEGDSEEVNEAKEALKEANEDYLDSLLTDSITAEDINSANSNISAATYRKKISDCQKAIKEAKAAVEPLQQQVDELNATIAAFAEQIGFEQNADGLAEEKLPVAEAAKKKAETEYKAAQEALKKAKETLKRLEDKDVSGGDATPEKIDAAKKQVEVAKTANDTAKAAYDAAEKTYQDAKATVENRNTSMTIVNLKSAKAGYEMQLYNVEQELKKAEAQRDALVETLSELVSSIGNIKSLESKLDAIKEAKKRVDELSEKVLGTTVTAPIDGKVTSISAVAGKTLNPSEPVAVLQPEGKGYFMSFSVTNEQAKRVSVGDRAELVNAWRYDDVEVTLASIKVDKDEPGQKKLLTFDVSGDVVSGQSLNISVGQKSANYDLIVPNSAIRQDSNGSFILIVDSKSSPLGTRYIADRVDVEVLASDDTQSAISAALSGYEFVITTSTKPVEAGKQVRLAD